MRPDWLLLTGLQSCRARVRRRDRSQPRIAGVMQVKNYRDSCSVFESLRALADFTIVLDDNSTAPFKYRDRCDEYLTLANTGPWNAVANRMLLSQRAFVHGCRWIVEMDDDIVFSNGFQTRADVLSLIEEAERRRADVLLFRLRDLWESTHQFRADGIWARKTFNVLVRNWFYYRSITLRDPARRLHSPFFPANMHPRRVVVEHHVAYHTGCLTREARLRRVEKYRHEDPDNAFQRDYEYMLSDDGLRVAPVPEEDVPILERKIRLEI